MKNERFSGKKKNALEMRYCATNFQNAINFLLAPQNINYKYSANKNHAATRLGISKHKTKSS